MAKRCRGYHDDRDEIASEPDHAADVPATKYKHIDTAAEAGQSAVISCSLAPHVEPIPFANIDDFESHYQKTHANRCLDCHKNLPSEHYLDLHISENHDPMEESRRARGDKTYRCFVEGCEKICATPLKRRMHLIDKHHFPKNFDFYIINDGIDGRSSMLRSPNRRKYEPAPGRPTQNGVGARHETDASCAAVVDDSNTDARTPLANPSSSDGNNRIKARFSRSMEGDEPMESLTRSIASLQFVPRNVRFGRGSSKGFIGRN